MARTSMATYRIKTRELLIRLVFQMSVSGDFSDGAKDDFLEDSSLFEDLFEEAAGESPDLPYFDLVFLCVREHLTDIDGAIDGVSEKWSVGRMSLADLSILRVAAAELMYIDDIDAATSIDEAVGLAKRYGAEKSAAFINGVLGSLARAGQNEKGALGESGAAL